MSRAAAPKFLLDLAGTGKSLLQVTVERLDPLVGPERVVVVTGVAHEDAVRAQLPALPPANLVLEPSPRDSTAAIGLSAALLVRRDATATIASFPADHVITDTLALESAVREAVVAARTGLVVTLGVKPTRPATAYGYIRSGGPLGVDGARSVLAVKQFVEKPDAETAAAYVRRGDFLWNAGMFVARADVLLGHISRHQPSLYDAVSRIADAWERPDRDVVMAERWPMATRIAIDYAVAEPVAADGGLAVVPADIGWDDIGDVAALAGVLGGRGEVQVLGDRSRVLTVDATGLVVQQGGRTVSLLGVQDIAVLDTADAVLVTTLEAAQRVSEVVAGWRQRGRTDLL